MQVTVKLFANLRKDRFKIKKIEYPDGIEVGYVIDDLAIPRKELDMGIIMINGKHAEIDTVLKNGDTLAVFPPVAGG